LNFHLKINDRNACPPGQLPATIGKHGINPSFQTFSGSLIHGGPLPLFLSSPSVPAKGIYAVDYCSKKNVQVVNQPSKPGKLPASPLFSIQKRKARPGLMAAARCAYSVLS
jgi:hypothetical protein